jgi:hypothetical protein
VLKNNLGLVILDKFDHTNQLSTLSVFYKSGDDMIKTSETGKTSEIRRTGKIG